MVGPVGAVIATLLDLGWKPSFPDCWWYGGDAFCASPAAVEGPELLHVLRASVDRMIWANAAGQAGHQQHRVFSWLGRVLVLVWRNFPPRG